MNPSYSSGANGQCLCSQATMGKCVCVAVKTGRGEILFAAIVQRGVTVCERLAGWMDGCEGVQTKLNTHDIRARARSMEQYC